MSDDYRITGVRLDPETMEPMDVPEEEHFMECVECGQYFDKRDLGQVCHHMDKGHEPLPSH